MKETRIICDCCKKEISPDKMVVLTLPIICHGEEGKYLTTREMDICEKCANPIMWAYYGEAKKHGSTGWMAVDETAS